MPDDDSHIQYQWILTHPEPDHDDIDIELWTDDETVRVTGGDDDDSDFGRRAVDEFLAKYTAAGYRVARHYLVNDPVSHEDEDEVEDGDEADDPNRRPAACPECGSPIEFDASYSHPDSGQEGPAWLCTGCKWGEWITV